MARLGGGRPMPLVVGVMGSASDPIDPSLPPLVERLGAAIARSGCTLITGACPGLPQSAVLGAAAAGGLVVGISPALSEAEHVKRYASPIEGFDVIVYTGSGLMGREVVNIRSSDVVIIVGGRSGTLGEFAIAYDEGRLIGVLRGTGGVADMVDELVTRIRKDTGAVIVTDTDPERLVERLIAQWRTAHHLHPHVFHDDWAQHGETVAPAALPAEAVG